MKHFFQIVLLLAFTPVTVAQKSPHTMMAIFARWDGEYKVLPLGRLDLDETVRLSRERNVEIVLRSEDNKQY